MIKPVIAFLLLLVIYHFGISTFQKMTNKERWSNFRVFAYSAGLATLSVLTLSIVVMIF